MRATQYLASLTSDRQQYSHLDLLTLDQSEYKAECEARGKLKLKARNKVFNDRLKELRFYLRLIE